MSKQALLNLEYFRSFSDEMVLLRLKEAESFWFELLINPSSKDAEWGLVTMAFWGHCRDLLELIAKERNLISRS